MCNSFSAAYSLILDSKDLIKGNYTKIPEVVLGANTVLTALGKTNTSVGRTLKKSYDTFTKNGHDKFYKFGQKDPNPVRFVMGITDCSMHKEGNWVKKYVPYVVGFGADLIAEGLMSSQAGSKVLNKISSKVSDTLIKNNKAKETVNALVSGVLYQVVANAVEDKVGQFTDKLIDKISNKNTELNENIEKEQRKE